MDDQDPVIVENSNKNILSNMDAYLQYIRDNIKQIIIDDELKYSDPMDVKKIYPDFTYTQFLYLLSRLYDRVFSVNTELLYISYKNKYNKLYDIAKVELCYDMYCKLCKYYGYNCSMEPFLDLIGIDLNTLTEWLTSGRSNLLRMMRENAKNGIVSRFENSNTPLLQLAAANYKYQLNTPQQEREKAVVLDVLPDLLALSDHNQKQPPGDNKKQIVAKTETIINPDNDIKNP